MVAAQRCHFSSRLLSLSFNLSASVLLKSASSFDGFADVVALRGSAVEGAGWSSGTGLAGFRCTGWLGGCRADIPEPPADAGGGELACSGGAFPGFAQIFGQRPGEPRLGMSGDDQPGPPVPVTGQVIDLQADQGVFDDGQRPR